jgi:hypothetical protein
MKTLEKLNDVFNVDTEAQLPVTVSTPVEATSKDDDFDLARNTLRNLINKNDDVMSELINIAKNSEHPRAFEVVGKLVEAQTNIAKELVGLHKTKTDIEGKPSEPSKIGTQNNIVFSGSTSDLMKMISMERARTIDSST